METKITEPEIDYNDIFNSVFKCHIYHKLIYENNDKCDWCGWSRHQRSICLSSKSNKKNFFKLFFKMYKKPGYENNNFLKLNHFFFNLLMPTNYKKIKAKNVAAACNVPFNFGVFYNI